MSGSKNGKTRIIATEAQKSVFSFVPRHLFDQLKSKGILRFCSWVKNSRELLVLFPWSKFYICHQRHPLTSASKWAVYCSAATYENEAAFGIPVLMFCISSVFIFTHDFFFLFAKELSFILSLMGQSWNDAISKWNENDDDNKSKKVYFRPKHHSPARFSLSGHLTLKR